MNTKLLAFIGIIAIAVIGVIYMKSSPATPKDAMMEKADSTITDTKAAMELKNTTPTDETMMKKDETAPTDAMQKSSSRYVTYSKDSFDAAKDKKRVYFFFAPWCPTCVPTDKDFQANIDQIPSDVIVFKTDYDSSTALKKQYAVTYQHTFVQVDATGKEVVKWNGGRIPELKANIK
ncbi:hypothetical protein KBC80_01475 [Candidatus Woesebacteria bacterium]|jgi:thiol-disulfide isomerase/thioredoxin|nr:hypothetical protein [Candidatus Woesebacteria bacterium]